MQDVVGNSRANPTLDLPDPFRHRSKVEKRFRLERDPPRGEILNSAAFHGHWRLCQFLIEDGANPNHPLPDSGETPLHAALSRANRPTTERVVALLLAAGAEPNVAARDGAETGCFMRDVRTRGETPLHRAAAFAGEREIQMLLDAGASPSARDAYGDTPLSWASWHLRPASVLRRLCFDGRSIHPEAAWTGDHGNGWTGMDEHLLGRPHLVARGQN